VTSAPDAGLLAPGWAGSPAAHATGDHAWLRALLDAEAALTRAQAGLGLAPAEAARAVTEAADPARFDVSSLAERARGGGNPVIPLVADLTKAVGEEYGPYVHRGATSQDVMDTATMLVAAPWTCCCPTSPARSGRWPGWRPSTGTRRCRAGR
jgi:3-carboxy-cis,cis-muconate cycloisomerase